MTIDELISELQRRRELHGGSTEVLVTWEGITKAIHRDAIYLAQGGGTGGGGDDPSLYIDADNNHYKERFQHPSDLVNNPR